MKTSIKQMIFQLKTLTEDMRDRGKTNDLEDRSFQISQTKQSKENN